MSFRMQELLAFNPRVLPAVNQVQVHPLQYPDGNHTLLSTARHCGRMKDAIIISPPDKYSATPAQLMV